MIELRFLGTGSLGDKRPKNKLSKDYRRFPTLLIGSQVLIDPSEDIFEFQESFSFFGLLSSVSDVLITHSHLDHLSVSAIEALAKQNEIRVWATAPVLDVIGDIRGVRRIEIAPFSRLTVGDLDIIALPANHATDNAREVALNFLIRRDKTLFYGLDGAGINPLSFEVLKEVSLDGCIFDCALADGEYSQGSVNHNNLDAVKIIIDILQKAGCCTDSTKYIISHLPSAKKGGLHDRLTEMVEDTAIKVAYDGYYICI